MKFDDLCSSIAVNFPLLFWGAFLFYAALLLFLLVKPIRKFLSARLAPLHPSNQSWIASLDAFRGFAALWVACFHLWLWNPELFARLQEFWPPVNAGPKAVALFGLLSGFLIFRSIERWRTSDELTGYFQRRFFRIYPVYFLVLILFFAFARKAFPVSWQLILSQLLMAPALAFKHIVYRPFWSLYAEELFYVIVPAWALLTRSRPLLFSAIASLLLMPLVSGGGSFYALFFFLFLGVTAATLADHPRFKKIPPFAHFAFLILGLALFYADAYREPWTTLGFEKALYAISPPIQTEEFTAVLGISLFLVILASLGLPRLQKLLAVFPLRYLGRISFGIFAWHGLIVSPWGIFTQDGFLQRPVVFGPKEAYPLWASFLVLIPALVFYGSLSYALIERPLMQYGRKLRTRR